MRLTSFIVKSAQGNNGALLYGEDMSKRETIEQKTEALLTPILEELGFELWDVEYVKEGPDYYLRAYIDKEGGIAIDDCVSVSRKLSDKLDEDDYIEDAYILEVSSPGLGRQLKKDKEFMRSIGRRVELKTYKPIDSVKEFSGVLVAFDNDSITLEIGDKDSVFARRDIAKVALAVEL